MDPKVSVYTKVYNTKPYLEQCLSSVLSQTYPNFEYIVVDNGCTDGSSEILAEYAKRDSRIILIKLEENRPEHGADIWDIFCTGKYFTPLDSDDWWEPNYLERLVYLAEENQLDIACTGSYTYAMDSGERRRYISTENSMIIQGVQFRDNFSEYYPFFRGLWGKLFRMEIVRHNTVRVYNYHADTICCFQILHHATRIGIDNSILHNYRIHKRSMTYQFAPEMVPAGAYVYHVCMDFISSFGAVSQKNERILQDYYIADMSIVLNSIQNSNLSAQDKIREYWTMINHPLTQSILQKYLKRVEDVSYFGPLRPVIRNSVRNLSALIWQTDLPANDKLREYQVFLSNQSMRALESDELDTIEKRVSRMQMMLQTGAELAGQEDADLRAIMQILVPRCGTAVNARNARLFLEDRTWLRSRLGDQTLWSFYMRHHRTFMLLFGSQSPLQKLPVFSIPLLQALIEDRPAALLRRLSKLAKRERQGKEAGITEAIQEISQAAEGKVP